MTIYHALWIFKAIAFLAGVGKTRAQPVTLSPGPTVEVMVNSSLQFTCSTTYTMKFVFIRDGILLFGTTAITLGNIGSKCQKLDGQPGYNTQCESVNGPFIFTINSVTLKHHNSKIKCIVQYGSSSSEDISAAETTILVNAPLEKVEIMPSGIVIMNVSETKEFKCSATSLPIPTISWQVGLLKPTTAYQPEESGTNDTLISRIIYIADKDHDGQLIVCLANDSLNTAVANTSLIIQFRPVVELSPTYDIYNVIVNTSNLQLTCTVTEANPNVTSYRWYRNDSLISADASLTLSTVKKSDEANYTCDATNIVGSSLPSSAMLLNVLYGAELISIDKQQPVTGELFNVECKGQANPAITDNDTTWTKQNNATFRQLGQQLIINDTKKIDAGIYICTVLIKVSPSNGQSTIMSSTVSFELDVLYRPVVTLSPSYKPYNVIENTTDLQLECSVTEANPAVTSYRWYKDGSQISTTPSYIIPIVNKSYSANYTCEAINTVGYSTKATEMKLNVLYGVELDEIDKKLPIEGNKLSIICAGRSNPEITNSDVTWTKQTNNTFRHTGRTLVINNVNLLDGGSYICNVVIQLKPSVGEFIHVIGTTSVEVEVLYRPLVEVTPVYNPYDVVENTTNLQLFCTVRKSNPPVLSYKWYKDGSVVSTYPIYTIKIVKRTHNGRYSCDATNIAGSSASAVMQLNVLYGITLAHIPLQRPHEGDKIFVTCNGSSNPSVTNKDVTWTKTKNDTFIQKGFQLSILNINRRDNGTYICTMSVSLEASNGLVTIVTRTTYVTVDVLFKPMVDEWKSKTATEVAVKENETLFLLIHLVANPIPLIQWSFINDIDIGKCNNNTVNSKNTFDGEHITSSILIPKVQTSQLGEYIVISKNHVGIFSRTYTVLLQGKPSPSIMVNVFCKRSSALVLWMPGFDGGQHQDFQIIYWKTENKIQPRMTNTISENKTYRSIIYAVSELETKTEYTFSIVSRNEYGNVSSGFVDCLTDDLYLTTGSQHVKDADMVLNTGIGLLIVASVILISMAFCFIVCRIRKRNSNSSSRTKEYATVKNDNPVFSTSYDSVNYGSESGNESQERTSIGSICLKHTNTYDEVETETEVKQPITKSTVENSPDKNNHVYESMEERTSDVKSKSARSIEMNVTNPVEVHLSDQHYESMKTPPQDLNIVPGSERVDMYISSVKKGKK